MALAIILGAFVKPVDGDTCSCTCSSMAAGTTSVSCSICNVSYCRLTYVSACGTAGSVVAYCKGVALPASFATVTITSLVALLFAM
jgi:hypothetical protein